MSESYHKLYERYLNLNDEQKNIVLAAMRQKDLRQALVISRLYLSPANEGELLNFMNTYKMIHGL